MDLELDVWGAEDLVVLLFADELWEAEFLVGTDFVFDFVVFSLSWVKLCEPRMELSPVDMFNCRWAFVTSVSPCVEVLADVTADCSILWPQSQQISTLRVRDKLNIFLTAIWVRRTVICEEIQQNFAELKNTRPPRSVKGFVLISGVGLCNLVRSLQ